jgi:hypothetical protein
VAGICLLRQRPRWPHTAAYREKIVLADRLRKETLVGGVSMNADKFKKLLIRTLEGITYIHATVFTIVVILGCVALQAIVRASS